MEMENNYKEAFCVSCYGKQKQLYVGKFNVGNETYDKFVCCMCGHENKFKVGEDDSNSRRY